MKLSSAIAGLSIAVVSAQDGRIRNCNFYKTFGSGSALDASGLVPFTVVEGADVTCWTGCKSGGAPTNVAYNVDSKPLTADDPTATATSSDENSCRNIETTFTAATNVTQLGWSISIPETYKYAVVGCYCTNDGSDFTIEGIEETANEIREQIEEYIAEVEDFVEENDIQGCFSESATVEVYGKGEVTMKDLELNDKVLVGKDTYEPVYTFGHRKPEMDFEFYQIFADGSDSPLEMTGNHMVMVKDSKGKIHATRADHLQAGDSLYHVGSGDEVTVTSIGVTKKTGLYMPLTPSGVIVVNGLLASNYISISDTHPGVVEHSQMFFPMNEQTLSHWWMSPARMMCMGVSSAFCSNGSKGSSAYETLEGDEGILPWLLMGRHFAHVAENQPTLIRFFLGVPTFFIFGAFNLVEHLFLGPSYAPFFFAAVVGLFITLKKACKEDSEFARSAGYGLLSSNAV